LQAVLGTEGTRTYRWWRTGLDRAVGVAAVRATLGGRIGTGFLVRGADLGLPAGDELLVLTNAHVINPLGATPGIRPEDAEVVFEAADGQGPFPVSEIVWTSPIEAHDATLVRLARPVIGIPPLPIARALPMLDEGPRVYVIGHPGGRDLAFSFQDNEPIDHEGRPQGNLLFRTCAASTTARRPKAAVPVPRCSTPDSGRWWRCTTAAAGSVCGA
jgi:hypothetical protein